MILLQLGVLPSLRTQPRRAARGVPSEFGMVRASISPSLRGANVSSDAADPWLAISPP